MISSRMVLLHIATWKYGSIWTEIYRIDGWEELVRLSGLDDLHNFLLAATFYGAASKMKYI